MDLIFFSAVGQPIRSMVGHLNIPDGEEQTAML
jgi:hypothetical protein